MKWAKQWILDFWFRPTSATNLAISRFLFFFCLFLYYLPADFKIFTEFPRIFVEPVWVLRITQLPLITDPFTVEWLQSIWKASLLASACGVLTRSACWTSALLGTYLIAMSHSFGKTHHNDALVCLFMFVFAISRCGDVFSVDALRSRRNPANLRSLVDGEYKWPLVLMRVLFTIMYLAAGISKLKASGLHWMYSDYMQKLMLAQHYTAYPPTNWSIFIAQWPAICQALAVITIVVELAVPMALFSKRARSILIPATYAMHLGIWLLLGPWFLNMIFCCMIWVDWNHCLAWLRRTFNATR